jgi:hypothetical protein
MTTEKLFTKKDLERAFQDGRLYDANELDLNTAKYLTVFDAWYDEYTKEQPAKPKIKYAIGDIVRVTSSFLGTPANELAYIYDVYGTEGSDYYGVCVITRDGTDLGGFSQDEQEDYLEFVKKSGYIYQFKNVIQLDREFETLIKPIFLI